MKRHVSTSEFAWRPDEQTIAHANWTAFIRAEGLSDYGELAKRANHDPEWFWTAVIRHLDFRFDRPYQPLIDA